MERLGLVGLPNAGKSALFSALTGMDVAVASHPFSTTETVVGVARVPDGRVEALGEMSKSKKLVHATVEFTDIAALVKGASTGEGLGNRFLGSLREADALVVVLRAFDDPNITGESDPAEALATLEIELVLADLESVQGRVERQRKAVKGDPSVVAEIKALEEAAGVLEGGVPLYRSGLAGETRADPYLDIQLRQPVPAVAFLPRGLEVIAHLRNPFGQGQVVMALGDGSVVELAAVPRFLRGGLSFSF